MTSIDAYLDRAAANHQLLTDMGSWKHDKPEWFIVFAFYAAIHYVKALGSNFDESWNDHEGLRKVSADSDFFKDFRTIKSQYDALEKSSRIGRYNPHQTFKLTAFEMDKAENAVKYIETHVLRRLGRTA